jgi:hypothetical protein
MRQIPNNNIPEAKDPIRKYFKPASLLLMLVRSEAAKMYSEMDSTSIPKKNMDRFPKDTIATAPDNKNIFIEI